MFHFRLHGSAALESVSAADYEGEVVGAEFAIVVGCVGVCISCAGEDGGTLDTRLKALLAQSEALKFWETVFLGCALWRDVSKVSHM